MPDASGAPPPSDLGPRFQGAVELACRLHHGQVRKSNGVPYISHPLAVASLVLEAGGDEDLAIAALLHDTVEDCGGWPVLEEIRQLFGDQVASVVEGCSDCGGTPKPPWRERKERYLEHLTLAGWRVRLVSAADKVHNLSSMLVEHRRLGPLVWRHFRAGRDGTVWYYGRILEILSQGPQLPGHLLSELERLYCELCLALDREALLSER